MRSGTCRLMAPPVGRPPSRHAARPPSHSATLSLTRRRSPLPRCAETRSEELEELGGVVAGFDRNRRDRLPDRIAGWTARATALRVCLHVDLVDERRQMLLEALVSLQFLLAVAEPAFLADRLVLGQGLCLGPDHGVRALCRRLIDGLLADTGGVDHVGRGEPVAVLLVAHAVAVRQARSRCACALIARVWADEARPRILVLPLFCLLGWRRGAGQAGRAGEHHSEEPEDPSPACRAIGPRSMTRSWDRAVRLHRHTLRCKRTFRWSPTLRPSEEN